MRIEVLKSKIHRVKITQAELHYVGSITIDETLMEAANLIEGEKVQVVNINNGERLETYVIKGERNTGTICPQHAKLRWAMWSSSFPMRQWNLKKPKSLNQL
jgi:L-aspartate-alpha-decarboxylase